MIISVLLPQSVSACSHPLACGQAQRKNNEKLISIRTDQERLTVCIQSTYQRLRHRPMQMTGAFLVSLACRLLGTEYEKENMCDDLYT